MIADAAAQLERLLDQMLEGTLAESEQRRLQAWLLSDDEALQHYCAVSELHSLLRWSYVAPQEFAPAAPAARGGVVVLGRMAVAYLSADPLRFGLFFATVAMISFLAVLAQFRFSTPQPARTPNRPLAVVPAPGVVARLTGEQSCRWAEPPNLGGLKAGQEFELREGLAEITFDSGVRVTLQAPARFAARGTGAAWLAEGRLTARITSRRGRGFRVTSPQAEIVDLGTEFGVYVAASGVTEVHVIAGRVFARPLHGPDRSLARGVELTTAEAARIEVGQGVVRIPEQSAQFVREAAPLDALQDSLSLADLITPGAPQFRSHKRMGIHPLTGDWTEPPPNTMANIENSPFAPPYRPVPKLPYVDGIFIPDPQRGPVVLDSAGHTFAGFPPTDGKTWSVQEAAPRLGAKLLVEGRLVDFSAAGRSRLMLHANRGITFDLQAIRQATGKQILGFRALVGCAARGRADAWVFVDGELRHQVEGRTHHDNATPLETPLAPDARFLTLVATDGGNTFNFDQIVFGDPLLLLLSPGGDVKPSSAPEGGSP